MNYKVWIADRWHTRIAVSAAVPATTWNTLWHDKQYLSA